MGLQKSSKKVIFGMEILDNDNKKNIRLQDPSGDVWVEGAGEHPKVFVNLQTDVR